jgi:uncharacterized protein (UPF0548 family)
VFEFNVFYLLTSFTERRKFARATTRQDSIRLLFFFWSMFRYLIVSPHRNASFVLVLLVVVLDNVWHNMSCCINVKSGVYGLRMPGKRTDVFI